MSKISVLGIDLGKSVIQVHGVDESGEAVVRRRLSRAKLKEFMARLEPCLVGMESGGGSQYWARLFRGYGHDARLMAPQHVKPYVKGNKTDGGDAQAVCEAVQRPTMRFVRVKTVEEQEVQMVHRVRSRAVKERTRLVNQVRGMLLEYGIAVSRGRAQLRRRLPEVLEDGENELTDRGRTLFAELYEEVCELDEQVKRYDARIEALSRADERCRRLDEVMGVGALTASAVVAHAGDGSGFASARHFAASLGLVPRQYSTGGKPRLLGISKRGDKYLRTLLIHCARAALRCADKRTDRLSRWAVAVERRRGKNVAVVALANKLARIVWALLSRGTRYQPQAA